MLAFLQWRIDADCFRNEVAGRIGFNANGDLFYTENQGDWVGSGRMTHVEKGDFVGNPAGLRWSGEKDSPCKTGRRRYRGRR